MKNLKKLTILHSNDMHGDFMAQEKDEKLIGGVSMLSGYLNKVRKEEKNVLYTISGDMFRGNVIDSEYKGMSTIEMMNMLAPDVVTLGNHEADYGIAHLLFLEKCARFPIVNANLYLTTTGVRLFKSHYIKEIDGMKIMFIGILTEQVLSQAKQDRLVGAFVDVREAATEIGKICNVHNQRIVRRTPLCFIDSCRRLRIKRICAQPIHRLGRKRHKLSLCNQPSRTRHVLCIRVVLIYF